MVEVNSFRLGVNIDHVATLRNARGMTYPSPLRVAREINTLNVDSITVHLREDRRHILDADLEKLCSQQDLPINLEMAATKEMQNIAIERKPFAVCLVPERREEMTTEGGLNVIECEQYLKNFLLPFKETGGRVSIFVSPSKEQIEACANIGVNAVELNSGAYCDYFYANELGKAKKEANLLKEMAVYARSLELDVHVGHGLTFDTIKEIAVCSAIKEFNIGHFLISEAIILGLNEAIKKMHDMISSSRE